MGALLKERSCCLLLVKFLSSKLQAPLRNGPLEKTDKFKPTTSRTPALHLQFYSSVSVWRGTEGGGADKRRERHLEEDYIPPSNKGEGAYGCCLDLMTCSAKH